MTDRYPQEYVFILRLENNEYISYVENFDRTKIKFFSSDVVIPAMELNGYIWEKYHSRIASKDCVNAITYGFNQNIRRFEPNADSLYDEYLYDNPNSRKNQKQYEEKLHEAQERYEEIKNSYPILESESTVSVTEVYGIIGYLKSHNQAPYRAEADIYKNNLNF